MMDISDTWVFYGMDLARKRSLPLVFQLVMGLQPVMCGMLHAG